MAVVGADDPTPPPTPVKTPGWLAFVSKRRRCENLAVTEEPRAGRMWLFSIQEGLASEMIMTPKRERGSSNRPVVEPIVGHYSKLVHYSPPPSPPWENPVQRR